MPKIQLQSGDNKIFVVDVEVAVVSGTIKSALEFCGMENPEDIVVPLPNVCGTMLEKILIWAVYHKNDPEPKEDDDTEISQWDENFLKENQHNVFELNVAASYLDMKGLVDVSCRFIANMVKDKTTEEIRTIFNIRNDFTPAELEEVLEEIVGVKEKKKINSTRSEPFF